MSENLRKVMDFSSKNALQSANFQKFFSDNYTDDQVIGIVAEEVARSEAENCDSNNEQFFARLRKAFEEEGLSHKIASLSSSISNEHNNNMISTPTEKKVNRTLSLDRPCTPNSLNSAPAIAQTPTDGGCFANPFKSFRSNTNLKLEPFRSKTTFQFDPSLEVVGAKNFGCHHLLPSYEMTSKKRGIFLYVNVINFTSNKPRDGAEKDRDNLITLFKEMDFTVYYFENLTRAELTDLLCKLINSKELKSFDSFVCFIQTHGKIETNLTMMEFSDGSKMATEELVGYFSNSSCPSLAAKPKIFFFPICRGGVSDKYRKTQTDGGATPSIELPSYNDILICYATVPGYTAHRDPVFGTWYVRKLCEIFAAHAHNTHLEDLLKLMSISIMQLIDPHDEKLVQVASTENRGFNKVLFFNPKKFQAKPRRPSNCLAT